MGRLRKGVIALLAALAMVFGMPAAAMADPGDVELNPGVNTAKSGTSDATYNIGDGQAVMIYGGDDEPVTFSNCVFNLSGGTVKITGDQGGIPYNNGEVVTKLWIGGNVNFENCTFVTAEGATKTTGAGFDAAIYFFSGDINLKDCTLSAESYNGQFLGLYGNEGAVTFDNSDISTVGNKNGWSYAMYANSVLKLSNGSVLKTRNGGSGSNSLYSGDGRNVYDAIFVEDSTIDFQDNASSGMPLNNITITVERSTVNVSNNGGYATNSGNWIVKDKSTVIMDGNGTHGLSCNSFQIEDSKFESRHNGYAGVYIGGDSSFKKSTVDIACNGEKSLPYSALDITLNGHILKVAGDCTSETQNGSAWLGGVGRTGSVETIEGSSVVAYDLSSNAADNLKSGTQSVLAGANVALNGDDDEHILFLNPFMTSDYARGNSEGVEGVASGFNDDDLFEDKNFKDASDITGADNAKIDTLTDAQLSHHRYDWDKGEVKSAATTTDYGVMSYPCVQACDDYAAGHTTEHPNSFDCDGTYVYGPLVGVEFVANAGDDTVAGLPEAQNNLAYGSTIEEPSAPSRSSGSGVNWVFTGWYTDAACTEKFDFSKGLTDNWTVLYAGWKQSYVDIDKVADPTDLNDIDETNVKLSIGATQDKRDVAVLFVLDYSTSIDVRNAAADMLEELASKENTNVKACVINYWADQDAGKWVTVDSSTDVDDLLTATQTGGTNLHGGLLEAKDMLSSEEITGYETYLVTISDGITYLWTDESAGTTMSVWYQNRGNGADDIQNAGSVYDMKYGQGSKIPEGTFSALVNGSEDVAEKYDRTAEKFEPYGSSKPDSTETDHFFSYNGDDYETIKSDYLIGTEIGIYKSAAVYRELVSEVDHAFALKMDENNWAKYPYGKQLMDWMISQADGGSVTDDTAQDVFAGITDEILYEIKSGKVTDIIGNHFDLTDKDAITDDTFTLTVGGMEQSATVDDGNSNRVNFGEPNNDGVYPYSVEYVVKDGVETLLWEINVPVEQGKGIELSYSLTLVNRETAAGTYNPPTNESAILEYEGTDGSEDTMEFPVPEVEYTVNEQVATIRPADITIYMGGTDGYEGVVQGDPGDGDVIVEKENSLPEPGYYFQLTPEMNEAIQKAYFGEESDGSITNGDGFVAVDLSDYVKVRSTNASENRYEWNLVRYGSDSNDSVAYQRFVYRLVPVTGTYDVRLQFTPEGGDPITSDNFSPSSANSLQETYAMGIYPDDIGDVELVATVNGTDYTAPISLEDGQLHVRYVTGDQNMVVTAAEPNENAVNDKMAADAKTEADTGEEYNKAYVVAPSDTTYMINGSDIDLDSKEDPAPSLLFDDVVSHQNTGEQLDEGDSDYAEQLGEAAIDALGNAVDSDTAQYEAKYLDLVDANNGNTWLQAQNSEGQDQTMTVYWPYPVGTDSSDTFHVVHFEGDGMERDETTNGVNNGVLDDMIDGATKTVVVSNAEKTPYGIKFTTDSFSPFVLVWDGTGSTPTPDPDPDPTPEPEPEGPEPSDPSDPTDSDTDVSKELGGRGLEAGEFTFQIATAEDYGSAVSPSRLTATNAADGSVDFGGGFTFSEEGTYDFVISEVLPSDDDPGADGVQSDGVTYDQATYRATATVEELDGKLQVTWTVDDAITFTNDYHEPEQPAEPDQPETPEQPGKPEEGLPGTGDAAPAAVAAVAGIGLACVAGAVVLRKRGEK